MVINVEEKNGISVVGIQGRLDVSSAGDLKKKYEEISASQSKFVFDLSEVDFLDSTGLGCVVSCLKSAVENDGNIYIAALQAKPRMVFEITRAYKIFDIFDDVDSAIESFKE